MTAINYGSKENVIQLDTFQSQKPRKVRDLQEDYLIWLCSFSENTQTAYARNLDLFFEWFRNKEISELIIEDLDIDNSDMLRYRTYLRNLEINYKNKSINAMVAAVQSFYAFLETNRYPVRAAWVSLKDLPENEEHAGVITLYEAQQMAKLVKDTPKGFEKSVLIELAYTASFRKDSLLQLKLSDIRPSVQDPEIYEVKTIGKGDKLHKVFIPASLYEKLKQVTELPYRAKKNDGKIFGLSKTTIQSMMDWLKQEMKIPEHRNIVFHSFRGIAASFGTLEEARAHFNHSNSTITEVSYRHINEDFSTSLSLRIAQEVDGSIFTSLSKQQLIQLIMQQQPGQIMHMATMAAKMLETIENN